MMDEYWDIYDANRNFTGRTHRRGDLLSPGDYHMVVHIWTLNSCGEFLITQRAPEKFLPLIWECTAGSALAGEDSLAAALREVREETGISLRPENGERIYAIRREDNFCDVWLFRQDVDLADFVPQPGETIDARLALPEDILRMMDADTFFRHSFTGALLGQVMGDHLLQREKMLICPPPGTSRAAIEALLARDFGEIGASGEICDRDTAMDTLLQRSVTPLGESWKIENYELRRLSETICLVTYILTWGSRQTRRSTIWRLENGAWRAAYHQGTGCTS